MVHDTTGGPNQVWPALVADDWGDTRDTLHLWTQVIGKVKLAHTPLVNHWWNITFFVTPRGLTTGPIPYGVRTFQIDFDLVDHQLDIDTSDGNRRSIRLEPRSVADFYAEVMGVLIDLGLDTKIWTMPVEIKGAIPFDVDHDHAAYDPDAATRFAVALGHSDRVLRAFRARFVGKASPVHFFWGSFDLAATRFSGRPAPLHPGVAPNCAPWVMQEAYSHEVSSAGWWPGGGEEGIYYAYAYPEPEGFRDHPLLSAAGHYDEALGEFVLPYREVRTAPDPDGVLLEFLQRTYEAAAVPGGWDRAALER